MDQATLLWTLASTFFAGLALFVQKVVAEEGRSSAFNGLLMYGSSGVVAIFILFSIRELSSDWPLIAAFGLAAGGVHGLGNFIRIESLKYIDSVIFFPLNKMLGPLLVVIGGIFVFGDALSITQYVGVALSLTVPLLLLSSAEHSRQKDLSLGLKLLFASTTLTAISLLLSKQGLLYGEVILMLCMSQIAGTVASAGILLRQHGAGLAMIAHADRRDILLGALSGLFGFTSAFSLFVALSTGLVSLVYVIQAHYILIPIVLSVWWYRDHINMRKLAAVAASFLAIGLLYQA
ncbi:EamA family transporter [Candidatus Kaiserbacteria bacterium]|nr:EamA family transporter [Candidatus Kaiserbacteria bacterium]